MERSRNPDTVISVIVCTYNRAHLLHGCLNSIANQTLNKEMYEVIVVDNNSTDQTQAIIEEFGRKNENIRGIKELQLGLSCARNRGWKEAVGQFVAYIDDDAKAEPDWVENIMSFIRRHPQVSAFGGPYEAFTLAPVPSWYPPEFGRWGLGTVERPIQIGDEWISGTNMIFRKDLLERLRGFNRTLGMRGNNISYGEETRLLIELKREGIDVWYVPDLKVYHLIADYKMNLRWLLKSCYAVGRCTSLTFNLNIVFPRRVLCLVLAFIRMPHIFITGRIPFKRRLYYACAPLFRELGIIAKHLESRKDTVSTVN